jgi:hypothetical protein
MPGAFELPLFVTGEITKDVLSLPALVPDSKPTVINDAYGRRLTQEDE